MMNRIKESFFLFFVLILFCNDCIAAIDPPTPIPQKLTPGFFYRQSPADLGADVEGVYAKSADYYSESLFADVPGSIKTHVFSQTITDTVKNWMGVVFFGVWSYPEEDDESVKKVQIPVRTLNASNHMTYLSDGKRKLGDRCIWKTGHGEKETKTIEEKRFTHIPSKGDHTEEKFIEYITQKKTQEALWEYFLYQTEKDQVPVDRKLDCVGFTFYSTNDACDSCLKKLLTFKNAGLSHFLPADVSVVSLPLPFFITYESKIPYNASHPYETSFADATVFRGSILFIPRPRLFRLTGAGKDDDGGFRKSHPKEYTAEESIEHQEIKFKEKQNPTYLILRIKDGDPVRVKVH